MYLDPWYQGRNYVYAKRKCVPSNLHKKYGKILSQFWLIRRTNIKGDGNPDDYYDLYDHEFWNQFHLNRLKNVEVVGVWIFSNGL